MSTHDAQPLLIMRGNIAKASLKLTHLAWCQKAPQKALAKGWLALRAQENIVDAFDVDDVGADADGKWKGSRWH